MAGSVLIIAFNRPDLIGQLVDIVVKSGPAKIYCSVDAPISGDEINHALCTQVKQYLVSREWPCLVHFRFCETNFGCHDGVISAIDWFFSYEKDGVILEDDCIPDISYFEFANELLDLYRADTSVGMISGMCLVKDVQYSWDYRFSRLVNIWGWATWADRWHQLVRDLSFWPGVRDSGITECYGTYALQQQMLLEQQFLSLVPTWGARWRLTCLLNEWRSIIPNVNLVQNVGFGRSDAVSKKFYHPLQHLERERVAFPLKHPIALNVDLILDEKVLDFYYKNTPAS